MSFTFRPLRMPSDGELLGDLLSEGFPELDGSVDVQPRGLHWKFADSASEGLSILAFQGDRPVGFYGVVPLSYTIDGEDRRVGLVVDVMSHPEIRRQGLFVATGFAAVENLEGTPVEVVTGYPVRQDVMPGHLKVGWTAGFQLPVYALPTGAAAPGAPWWMRALGVAGLSWRVITSPLRRGAVEDVVLLDAQHFAREPAVRRLCAPENQPLNRLNRTEDFWRWRLGRPGVSYQCLLSETSSGAAFAVARASVLRGVPSLVVLDIEWDCERARKNILAGVLKLAREMGLPLVAICANPTFARAAGLVRAGFIKLPVKFTLIYRSTSGPGIEESFADESGWALTWIDSDTL